MKELKVFDDTPLLAAGLFIGWSANL